MRRRLFTFLTAASLLLCVATCVLWGRSYQADDRFSFVLNGDRYTLTSVAGLAGISGPPPEVTDPRVRRAAREVVAAVRDDQVYWVATFSKGTGTLPASATVDCPEPLSGTPADQADAAFAPDDLSRPLLDALEDPDRFVAAHSLLFRRFTPGACRPGFQLRANPAAGTGVLADEWCPHGDHRREPWVEVDLGGLPVTLRRWMTGHFAPVMGKDLDQHPMVGDPDATRFDAVRDAWHRRLDVQAVAVPHWRLVAGTGLLPLLWLVRVTRTGLARRARLRVGKCRACGYDLRATPGRCPECGARREGVAA